MILNVRTTQELKVLQLGGRCECRYLKTYNPTYIINEAKDLLNVVKKEGV